MQFDAIKENGQDEIVKFVSRRSWYEKRKEGRIRSWTWRILCVSKLWVQDSAFSR